MDDDVDGDHDDHDYYDTFNVDDDNNDEDDDDAYFDAESHQDDDEYAAWVSDEGYFYAHQDVIDEVDEQIAQEDLEYANTTTS